MNRKICEACVRFVDASPEKWWCARDLHKSYSEVIPGHSYIERDRLHPIHLSNEVPPAWCDFSLEQTVSEPDDKLSITHQPLLIKDGNTICESRGEWITRKKKNQWNPFGGK